ncbi:MAG: ATP-binding protein [Candidatus Pacearchaeota archaeon]
MAFDIIIGRNVEENKLFGSKALAFLGKTYVRMGNYISLSNKIYLDISRSHVILVAGKRGSGKSYTLGAIAESIGEKEKEDELNISSIIFDTMGIFWTMKFKNYKDKDLLSKWGLEPKNIPVEVFSPAGFFSSLVEKGIPVDSEFKIKISEMEYEDWLTLFNLDYTSSEAALLIETLKKIKETKENFNFEDIEKEIKKNEKYDKKSKNSIESLFEIAKSWGIFSEEEGIKVSELIKKGQTSVLDLSMYPSTLRFNIRALIIGIVCRKIFNERMQARKEEEINSIKRGIAESYSFSFAKNLPLVWVFIDEAHEFLPKDEKTPATESLIQLLREGRQPGISLVLATQQPGKIHTDVMTQSDIVISHRLTSEQDIKALNEMMQTYLYEGLKKKLNDLPKEKGAAILLDDNSERIYPIRVRPRYTWHGGETPSSIIRI